MLHRLLSFLVLLALPAWLSAQTCGRTDTFAIASFGTSSQTINIAGYLNNNLANSSQGLCGVTFYFEHSYVYDFTFDLTSPGGQTVQLIGPENNQTRPPTNLARWFIDFVQCGDTPMPDPNAPPRFNNNNSFNWNAFGLYRGSYQPAAGCLEDFDRGAVNGDWTLTFNNFRPIESGRATYVLLTFCDDRNEEGPCCQADAGEPEPVPPTEVCMSDADLSFDFPPRYRRPRPSADEYGYAYLITRDGQIVATQSQPDLSGMPAGDYTICGLSYRLGELDQIPVDGSISLADFRENLDAVDPLLCADVTDVCREVTIYAEPEPVQLRETICLTGSYQVGSSVYTESGSYTDVLTGRGGCDSIVLLDLEVVDVLRETNSITLCSYESYTQGGNVYSRSGTFIDTIASSAGCDSISTINLTVLAPIVTDSVATVCAGDSIVVGDEAFTATGEYSRTLTATNGCDSTVNLTLRVLDPQLSVSSSLPELVCAPASVLLTADTSVSSPVSEFRWYSDAGTVLSTDTEFEITAPGRYIAELSEILNGVSCRVYDTLEISDRRFAVDIELAGTQVQGGPDAGRELILDCNFPIARLDAVVSPDTAAYQYKWVATDGSTISGPTDGPSVALDRAGNYRVEVVNAATGCGDTLSFTIVDETLTPRAAVEGSELLNCARPSLTLTADTLQADAAVLTYAWTGDCLATTITGPQVTIDCPGNYQLLVTNTLTGCTNDTLFTVRSDRSEPTAIAPASAPINCYNPLRTLDAGANQSANGLEYSWRRVGDTAVLGDGVTLEISRGGNYELLLTDVLSRCTELITVAVAADTLVPMADAGSDTLVIDCNTQQQELGGPATSVGGQYRYAWVDLNEPSDTLARTRNLTVLEPGGLFEFSVIDVDNGCVATDRSRVQLALDTPFIRLELPLDFDCLIDSVAVTSLTNLNYRNRQRWEGPCVPAFTDTSTINVGCPGTYYYTVVNEETGCMATDSVNVELADNSVVAVLPDSVFLDCESGEAVIDRSAGTNAPFVTWMRDGQTIELLGMTPRVTLPGMYTLILSNAEGTCRDTARTVVTADCPVLSVIVPPDSLTCLNSFVDLDARPSFPSSNPELEETWIVPNGAITENGASARQLRVFTSGRYGFAIRNPVAMSDDTVYVDVIVNRDSPLADAGPRDTLTCNEPLILLDGSGSDSGPNISYFWATTSNDTLSTEATVRVGEPGTYLLTVMNEITGCTDVDNVSIFEDTFVPDLSFSNRSLPCDTVDFPLAVLPDQAGDYSYVWSGPAILSDADRDTVRLSEAGNYRVQITNRANGCEVSATAVVERLPCPPFPSLSDTSLTCKTDVLQLTTTFRDPCEGCTFRWTRNGTDIVGQTDSILPVDRTGVYRIFVVNRFGLRGSATATVTDDRVVPLSNAGPDRFLTCDSSSVRIGLGITDTIYEYGYRWLGSGARTATLRVDSPGTYILETTNLFSQCSVLDTVSVSVNRERPVADAGPPRILDCDNPLRVLDGLRSSTGARNRYAYTWAGGVDTACIEGGNTLNPIVSCGGDYVLTVLDRTNGCTATSTVRVTADDELPEISPVGDITLTCRRDVLEVSGSPAPAPSQVYTWQKIRGGASDTISTENGIALTEAGRYRYSVVDTVTGCANEFSFRLKEDRRLPSVNITTGAIDTFYCELDSVILEGSATTASGTDALYSWSSRTGFFIGGDQNSRAVTFQPDLYYLSATDRNNGCVATDSIMLIRDNNAPVPDAGKDTTLTCTRRMLTLRGSTSTISGQATYQWSTLNGNIVRGSNSTSPVVDRAARYLLEVTDPVNGCKNGDIVRVSEDTLAPLAQISTPMGRSINCRNPAVALVGSSPTLVNPLYQWSSLTGASPPGNLTAGRINVRREGTYQLVVTSPINGCRDTSQQSVLANLTKPIASAVPPPTLSCSRNEVVLRPDPRQDRPAYQYAWLVRNGASPIQSSTLTVENPGVYYLVTTDTGNGCSDSVAINVTADVNKPTIVLAPPLELNCSRAFATIDGRGSSQGANFSPRWQSPGSSAIATANPYQVRGRRPGWYYLTVTNTNNGCSTRDSVELVRSAVAITAFEIDTEQPACLADPFGAVMVVGVEGGAPPLTYSLDGGLYTERQVYEDLPIGNYSMEVRGKDGCSRTANFVLSPGQEISLDLRRDTFIRLGDSVVLDFETNVLNYDTLFWSSSGPLPANLNGTGPLTVRPFTSQSYRLLIDDGEGCQVYDEVLIRVDEEADYFMPTAFSPNGDGINDFFHPFIGPQVVGVEAFRVFDRWGELVYDSADDPENIGWDGTKGGRPLNSQVFAWQVQFMLIDGRLESKAGEVLLVR